MNKKIIFNDDEKQIHILYKTKDNITFEYEGKEYSFKKINEENFEFNGKNHKFKVEKFDKAGTNQVFVDNLEAYISLPGKVKGKRQGGFSEGSLQSPMPGKIFKVFKKAGDIVKKDEAILILEAMKMEHTIKAQKDGVLKTIHFKEGEQVTGGAQLCEIE
jgi:biotin carboxyl carrier protein